MIIGVDARSLCGSPSGIGRYLIEILNEIILIDSSIKFVLYLSPYKPSREVNSSFTFRTSRLPRQIALKFVFNEYCNIDQIDIFWAVQTLLPGFRRTSYKTVSTIHDLNHILVPETMSPVTRISHKLFFESDLHRADSLVCNSLGTSNRLKDFLDISCSNIARPGVSKIFRPSNNIEINNFRQKHNISRPYYLSLSTSEPRKNIPLLLDTYIEIYDENPSGTPLMLLAGPKGWQDNSRYMNHPGIRHLGYLEYSDLPALYSGAEAFIFPSVYEGFGMPAAEASACGTAVIATDIPEIREAAGPYGVFINPDKTSLKNAILGLEKTRPEPYIAGTWENAARTYIQVFKSLV